MFRSLVRSAFSLGCILAGDALQWGSGKVVGWLMAAPVICTATDCAHESTDHVQPVPEEDMEALFRRRASMSATPPRKSRPQTEDGPPLQPTGPLVGSIEWRRQQGQTR